MSGSGWIWLLIHQPLSEMFGKETNPNKHPIHYSQFLLCDQNHVTSQNVFVEKSGWNHWLGTETERKQSPKNGLARHWIKLTNSNITREQWISMNQVILFVTFYPLVGAFLRSNLKDQLNIQLSQETGCLTLLGARVLGFGMCFDCQIPKPSIGTIVYWPITTISNELNLEYDI